MAANDQKKKTQIPADPDDLICDTCPNRFTYRGDTFHTFESARVKGWHIYQHIVATYTRGDDPAGTVRNIDTRILCPDCVGTPRSRLEPPPPVLEGQGDMFDVLGITAQPVEKERKHRKGKENQ